MAKKTFDLTSDIEENPIQSANDVDTSFEDIQSHSNKSAMTEEEVRDPNRIEVVISDPSPVIVLFGARTSGKTMTLVRLTRYLRKLGYQVEPDRIFRPSKSKHYQTMCDEFDKTIANNTISGEGTQAISFMLVKVMNAHGEPICQILEAPGEHYFDADFPTKPFPNYINNICNIDNPKTWVFIVEKGWKDDSTRRLYAQKIKEMESQIETKDKIIFTCHKADLHKALLHPNPNVPQFFTDIKNQYPEIFDKYKNKNPITSLWRKYNFNFVVFSAGTFNETEDKITQTYNQSKDKYPAWLWKAIFKTIKGGWSL
jgi:hypothetical protein